MSVPLLTIKISQRTRENFCSYRKNANRIAAIFNISSVKMDRIVLLESTLCPQMRFSWVTSADKRRLSCEVELSSALQASQRSMPGIDYNSKMFTYAVTVSQAVPAAKSQVFRPHVRTRLSLFQMFRGHSAKKRQAKKNKGERRVAESAALNNCLPLFGVRCFLGCAP